MLPPSEPLPPAGTVALDDLSASVEDLGAVDAGMGTDVTRDAGGGVTDATVTMLPDGGNYVPPGADDSPLQHAPPGTLAGVSTLLVGQNVLDVSTDQGGGVWAVTASQIYYFPSGAGAYYTYSQSSGLARGWYTWTDTYYSDVVPSSFPVVFTAVAGALAGEALVGNEGAIGDRIQVNPQTGAVLRIDNMAVTVDNSTPAEYPEHVKRVVATHKIVADLNGTYNGTGYVGGWHGFSAFHGLGGDCQCMLFEQHVHYIPPSQCDSSDPALGCWDGDVWGLAITAHGDVWAGDRHFVQLLPQRSLGARAGLFDGNFSVGIDVFPNVRDEVHGLAVDAAGGVYVASEGNGLAYLAPTTYAPSYWSRATTLPQNRLHGVAVDKQGEVWIGTVQAGIIRYTPAQNSWSYYNRSSGLPSDAVNTVYVDPYGSARTIYVATQSGVAIYHP